MKKILLSFLCVACLLCASSSMYAQKYGYVNLGNLLTKMPEVETGSVQLEAYQKKISEDLQAKITDWEQRVEVLQAKVNELPAIEVKAQEAQFLKEQEEIYREEQGLSLLMVNKRKEIMGPILSQVQSAIDAFGKENGYTMIFDTSVSGITLFVDEAIDVSKEVLTKLGIKVE